jgi:hypothetical protein
MPKTPVKTTKPAAKKSSKEDKVLTKTAPKTKASPKEKGEKVSVVKEKDAAAKVLKADELL